MLTYIVDKPIKRRNLSRPVKTGIEFDGDFHATERAFPFWARRTRKKVNDVV